MTTSQKKAPQLLKAQARASQQRESTLAPTCNFALAHADSAQQPARAPRLRKVAAVVVQLEVVQVDDVGGDGVEEVAVVRHHYQRLLPALQVLLRTGQGINRSAPYSRSNKKHPA